MSQLEPRNSKHETSSDELRLLEWANVLLSHKLLIIFLGFLGAGVAYGLCKTARPFFTAEATILPNREAEQRSLEKLWGLNIARGTEDMLDVFTTTLVSSYYMELLHSDSLLRPLMERQWGNGETLAQMFKLREKSYVTIAQQTLASLRKSVVKLRQDRSTGMISILCTTPDPGVSAEMANSLVEGLKKFLMAQRTTDTSRLVSEADQKTSEAESALKLADNALENFDRHNKNTTTPDLITKRQQLQREIELQKETWLKMKTTVAILRVSEKQKEELILVIQPAEIPWKKSWPPTMLATLGSGMFGGLLAVMLAFVRHGIRSLAERGAPGYAEFVQNMRSLNHWLPGVILLLPKESRRRPARRPDAGKAADISRPTADAEPAATPADPPPEDEENDS